jgi:HEAT repeat protein
VIPALQRAMTDGEADVRWNAAVALARFGDRSAAPVIREMLDRNHLARIQGIREEQKEQAILVAVPVYARLMGREAEPELRKLAESDPSLEVRSVAKEALASPGR